MRRIFSFRISKRVVAFVLLFVLSFSLVVTSHAYQGVLFLSSSNTVVGTLFDWRARVYSYFNLANHNEMLINENYRLRELVSNMPQQVPLSGYDYDVIPAFIIKNSIVMRENYLLVDKGGQDGIKPYMGLFSPRGVVGVAEHIGEHYTRALSILNAKTRISAGLKGSNAFGIITWNGMDRDIVQLQDIPKRINLKKGDTIITSGMSFLFPRGIPIGTVDQFEVGDSNNFYSVDIRLLNDMSQLGPVYFVENKDYDRLKDLERAQ